MSTFPKAFEQRMRIQLGTETEEFLAALRQPAPVSIRVNPGKVAEAEALEVMGEAWHAHLKLQHSEGLGRTLAWST